MSVTSALLKPVQRHAWPGLPRDRESTPSPAPAAPRPLSVRPAPTCDVTISLVAYNQRDDLVQLLPSLQGAAACVDSEVLLVDYRSQDGTDRLLAEAPFVQVCRNDRATGYGANHNLNLARARGRYFAVMNADLVVNSPDLFAALGAHMDRHPDIGILGVKVLNRDGTIQGLNKRYPTILDLLLRRYVPPALQPLVQRRLDHYEMRDVGYDRECDLECISGAFMFCRTDLLRSLGGFDPRYFLYFEDVDLCRRVQGTHRTSYYPGASVTHRWHRNSHKSALHTRLFLASAARYFLRWGCRLA